MPDAPPLAHTTGVRDGRVIAIVRDAEGRRLREICEALIESGIRAIEVTTNTPDAFAVVGELARHGNAQVGMGTVRTLEHVRRAADAGASFVVTPALSLPVGQAALDIGLQWYPGGVTPTEVEIAWNAGATAVKVFPVATFGGPRYISEIRAPLDDIPLIPTGGVRIEDIGAYLQRGSYAVGIGSPLLGRVFEDGDLVALRTRAQAVLAAIAESR